MNWQACYLGCFGVGLCHLVSFLSGSAPCTPGEVASPLPVKGGPPCSPHSGATARRRISPRLTAIFRIQFRFADGFLAWCWVCRVYVCSLPPGSLLSCSSRVAVNLLPSLYLWVARRWSRRSW